MRDCPEAQTRSIANVNKSVSYTFGTKGAKRLATAAACKWQKLLSGLTSRVLAISPGACPCLAIYLAGLRPLCFGS